MTGDSAVCLFASSLLRHKKAFVLDGERWRDEWEDSVNCVLKGVHGSHVFDILKGPPDGRQSYACAETGPRFVGDGESWIIRRRLQGMPVSFSALRSLNPVLLDAMVPSMPVRGPPFEVVDFSMVHDDSGTYMRVGEPFVWRYILSQLLFGRVQLTYCVKPVLGTLTASRFQSCPP